MAQFVHTGTNSKTQ